MGAAEHLQCAAQSPTMKGYLAQNVDSSEDEKPSSPGGRMQGPRAEGQHATLYPRAGRESCVVTRTRAHPTTLQEKREACRTQTHLTLKPNWLPRAHPTPTSVSSTCCCHSGEGQVVGLQCTPSAPSREVSSDLVRPGPRIREYATLCKTDPRGPALGPQGQLCSFKTRPAATPSLLGCRADSFNEAK